MFSISSQTEILFITLIFYLIHQLTSNLPNWCYCRIAISVRVPAYNYFRNLWQHLGYVRVMPSFWGGSIVHEGKSATLENNSTHCAGSICLLWIEWLIYIHHCPPVNNETWQGRNFEGVHYREIAIWTCKLSGIDIVYVHTYFST